MKSLELYRGITIAENEADRVIEDIKTNGLYWSEKQHGSGMYWKDIRHVINELYENENLTREDTAPSTVWIGKRTGQKYADYSQAPLSEGGGHLEYLDAERSICFADRLGAQYYATVHNIYKEKNTPLLIHLNVDVKQIAIDGVDFLYTVFGFINPKEVEKTKRQTNKLKRIFGQKIEKYIEKISRHPNSERFAICDLIICDEDIIADHSKNNEIIGGRYGTIFKSAFLGRYPVTPDRIISVEVIKDDIKINNPTITLNDFLER